MTGDETRGCQEGRSFVLARNTPHPDRVTSKGQDGTSFFSLFIMLLIQTVIVMDALSSGFIICLMTISESPSTVCCSGQNKYHLTAFSNWLHWLSILGGRVQIWVSCFQDQWRLPKKIHICQLLQEPHLGDVDLELKCFLSVSIFSTFRKHFIKATCSQDIFESIPPPPPYTLHFAYSSSCKDIFEIFL